MFTNQECRQILGSSANLTDAELDLLRIRMYEWAEKMVEVFIQEGHAKRLVESKISNQNQENEILEYRVQDPSTKH